MTNLDLRPLSVGEILDRTFTLYRNYFILFLGISVIPHILVLALNLAQVFLTYSNGLPVFTPGHTHAPQLPSAGAMGSVIGLAFLGIIVTFISLLLSQGATVVAVSELYLGRTVTIADSFRRVFGKLGTLFGVLILNGLAMTAGFLLFIFPGFYVMCRFLIGVPVALLENMYSHPALERSWELTRDNAGRAFLIILLYFALNMAAVALFAVPFEIGMFAEKNNPSMMLVFMALMQVGAFIATVLVTPVMTIASSVFYYDLRVRKEAFDLQIMLAPLAVPVAGGVPKAMG
jgi:hypothetical protein